MTSGYDKLAELREKASPGPYTPQRIIGTPEDVHRRQATENLKALSPILAEVIGELRTALERNANTIDLFRQGAAGQAALVQRFNATLEALTNTDKKLQEALND